MIQFDSKKLAVVVPAYKSAYLARTLESLVRQTRQDFAVYVCDDQSPYPVAEICTEYATKLDLTYLRFPTNLGGESLIGQWNRCVKLAMEPWVWLLSDDDTAEPTCVERFFKCVEDSANAGTRVFCFDLVLIDQHDKVVAISPPHPPKELGLLFMYHRLCGNRHSCVSNWIFSREVFETKKGFVNLPVGWYADDATWCSLTENIPIVTIEGPRVHYRSISGDNLSSPTAALQRRKILAQLEYIKWVLAYHEAYGAQAPELTQAMLKATLKRWFFLSLLSLGGIPLGVIPRVVDAYEELGSSRFKTYVQMLGAHCSIRLYRMLRKFA